MVNRKVKTNKIRKKTNKNKRRTRKTQKGGSTFKVVKYVEDLFKCENKEFGCEIAPVNTFQCYRRYRTHKNKDGKDTIKFTNRKKDSKPLKKNVLKVDKLYDCGHFQEEEDLDCLGE